ncbi:unnamed protein product [Musa acuminata subsp. burmannicoides]
MGAIEQSKQAAVERHGRGNGVFGGNELASRCATSSPRETSSSPPTAAEKGSHMIPLALVCEVKKGEKQHRNGQERKQAGEECDTTARKLRAPKAVDEDLYKIPPELLCRKPKRVSSFICFPFSCRTTNSSSKRDSPPPLLGAEEVAEELVVRMPGTQLHCVREQ